MTIELVLLPRVAHRGREITSPRLGGLLALLADDLRTGASTTRLIEGLWPDERPEHPAKALQVLVSRARAQLGPDVIDATPAGYRLTLPENQVDTSAIQVSAAACARLSRSGDHEAALAHAEAGLAIWTAPAHDDAGSADPLSALRTARASTCRWLVRARALCRSRLGRADEAVDELVELASERPRDEELLVELLRSEAATAGPAAALARYEDYRRGLREELGSDPGPALRELHQQLLQGEAPAVRHGVAHEPNPLLGRYTDLAALAGLLRTSRVTSIVGAGGLGKTRLAHAVSRRAEQRIVHFVPLAGVTHDDDVAAEVVSAVGGADPGGPPGSRSTAPRDAVTGILDALGTGPALLVLDNCEHVVRGAADLVRTLIALSADLRVLTTSRTPLDLSSESVYPLPELNPATAAELFRQRADAVRPDVELPDEAVRELCTHLDGLPLAIELAAARTRVMSVAEIARHLDDRFALLRGGAREVQQRGRHVVADDGVEGRADVVGEPAVLRDRLGRNPGETVAAQDLQHQQLRAGPLRDPPGPLDQPARVRTGDSHSRRNSSAATKSATGRTPTSGITHSTSGRWAAPAVSESMIPARQATVARLHQITIARTAHTIIQ